MAEEDPLLQEPEDVNLFGDVVLAPFRGILGATQSIYDLGDYFTGDILPDIDIRFLGKSKTMAGGIVEGASQFLTGFIPVVGALGKAGQLAKAGSLTQKALSSTAARSAIAGVAADFTVFSEQEQRLSNLIQQYPQLQNPVTEYLATQEDDSVIEGRLKNALEGLGLGLMVDGLVRGIKAVKKGTKAKAEGATPDEVAGAMRGEFGDDPETLINEAVRDVDPDPQAKVIDEETGEVLDDAAPQPDKEETFEVVATKDGFERKREGSSETADNAYESFKAKIGNTGRGGRVNYNTTSTEDAFDILEGANRAVRENEDIIDPAETVQETLSAGKIEKEALEQADELAPDQGKFYKDALAQASGNISALQTIRRQITAFRLITEDIFDDMTETYGKLAEYGIEKTKAVLAAKAENLYEFIAMDSRLRRQFGKGLREVAIFTNKKKTVNSVEELMLSDNSAAEAWLRDRKQDWINKVVDIMSQPGSKKSKMKKILGITEASSGGKFDIAREVWINNLLSGIPTQTVNLLGGVATTLLDTFELTVGGLLSGRPDVAKQALATLWDLDSLREAYTWGKTAWKKDEQFLIPGSDRSLDLRPRAALTPEAFNLEEGDTLYGFVDKLGKIMRLPSRGLSSGDEFFKQFNARRAAKFKASIEAIEKEGLSDPKEIVAYVQKKIDKLVSEGGEIYSQRVVAREGLIEAKRRKLDQQQTIEFVTEYIKKNYDKDKGALADYARDVAEELTFTKRLDPKSISGGVQKFVGDHPAFSFVLPFIRTPVNILKYAIDRSIIGIPRDAIFKPRNGDLLIQELRHSDPVVRAKAAGRVSTAAAAMAMTMPIIGMFGDRISGGGPRDPRQRKRLEDTGWQPYSIKFGDSYVSYQRLDPLATVIGVYADMNDMLKEGNFDFQQSGAERVFYGLLTTLQRNITNKSYLAGMEQFASALSDDTGKSMQRIFDNVAINTAIPLAGFWRSTGKEIVGEIMGQDDMKELRNLMDKVRQYDPTGSGFKLDPRRNIIGEEKEIEAMFNSRFTNAVSPIRYRRDKDDLVMDELAALNHSFSEPSPNYRGLIDLTAYRNSKGQSAHDRRLELMGTVKIKGKTLRQALEQLIKSKDYQKLSSRSEPALPSPRIKEINRLLSRYRAEGFDRAIREFPELKDFYTQYKEVQRQQRRGAELDNLIQTLNF